MITPELKEKMDFYEQVYFSLDLPIPFKPGLDIHPIKVPDYYTFYSCLGCLTMDKTVKEDIDSNGQKIVVPNPEGIAQSELDYLISQMKDPVRGALVTRQVSQLFSLIFDFPEGLFCPNCGETISYAQILPKLSEFENSRVREIVDLYNQNNPESPDIELTPELFQKLSKAAEAEFYQTQLKCPKCEAVLHDSIKIENAPDGCKFYVKDQEITSKDFEFLQAVVPRQNILDYTADEYMDPDLKEELEIKARLQNQDYTAPTLEKQIDCVAIGTGYTLEYIKSLTMRRLSRLLKGVDNMRSYYAQYQGAMSGLVSFKEDPKHWIFSDDKKNIAKELTDLDSFEKKFERVT